MGKTRIKVNVASRTIPGADQHLAEGQALTEYPGYGAAGIYFPAGDSEHVVTDAQLEELRALKKPKDAQGRPQTAVPLIFQELGPAPDDDETDADKTPAGGTPVPSVSGGPGSTATIADADKVSVSSRYSSKKG